MHVNLISVSCIQENGYFVCFRNNCMEIIREEDGACALKAPRIGRSYKVKMMLKRTAYTASENKSNTKMTWHNRLGHPGNAVIDELIRRDLMKNVAESPTDSKRSCNACLEGKMTRRHFGRVLESKSTRKLDLVHSDLCGPMSVNSFGGALYFLILVDDATRMTYVSFLKKKSETLREFKSFVSEMENQGRCRIRALRTDNGTEYCNADFKRFLKFKGIEHQTSAPYTPEQNGLAERTNRTLIEKARCMIAHSKLSKKYWAEAVNMAAYLKNISPTRVLNNKIPAEVFYGKTPSYSHLWTFGCLAYVHVPKEKRKKWDTVSKPCIFVGYTKTNTQYRFMDPVTRRLVISGSAKFLENESCKIHQNILRIIKIEEDIEDNGNISIDSSLDSPPTQEDISNETAQLDDDDEPVEQEPTVQPAIRRSTRHSTPPKRLTYEHADTDEDDDDFASMYMSTVNDAPETYEDAVNSNESSKWTASMQREYDALVKNETWSLMPLPHGKKTIPCRWVYKIKKATRAEPEVYKSRLVAKGFRQIFGIDYDDTYAPVVRLTALRVLLTVAIQKKMFVHGMDVKNAFLNGTLNHEIYMEQPDGYVDKSNPEYVCRLNKTVYGLKQSPRAWYKTITPVLEAVGVSACPGDSGIFSGSKDGVDVLLAIYVDDLFIACTSMKVMDTIKSKLSSEFAMKDLGMIKSYLAIDIDYRREEGTVILSQGHAVRDVLRKFHMEKCKPSNTPMEAKLILKPQVDGETTVTSAPYRQLIGCIMYLMLCTRPDISFCIGVLSKFSSAPTEQHWTSAKRVLRYLQSTKDKKLKYRTSEKLKLIAYTDADWASSYDRKSTTGFLIYVGDNLVSWSSKKQSTVALSTTEAEIIAATETMREVLWIRQLLLSFNIEVEVPILYCDSQPAIAIAHTTGYHARSKHLDVKYKFLAQCVEYSDIELVYKATRDMIADVMTKSLPRSTFENFVDNMGMSI